MANSFGQLIKEQRIAMGLTQPRLAELVGRSPSTVRSWERERTTPNDPDVLVTLAAVLGIDPGELGELAGVELDPGFAQPRLMVPASFREPDPEPPRRVEEVDETVGIDISDVDDEPIAVVVGPEVLSEEVELVRSGDGFPREDVDQPDAADAADDEPSESAQADAGLDPVDVIEGADAGRDPDATEMVALDVDEATPEGSPGPSEWIGDPTQVLMLEDRQERLLGIATAQGVEFVAEPRKPMVTEPEPTEVVPAPVVPAEASVPAKAPDPAGATTPVDVVRTVQAPVQRTQTLVEARPKGPDSYLEDPKEVRGYRIRAALTVAALIGLLLLGQWAWAGFKEQIGNILDSFTTGF